jgi:hypothetical protein
MRSYKRIGIELHLIWALRFDFSVNGSPPRKQRRLRSFPPVGLLSFCGPLAFKASEVCFSRWHLVVRPEIESDGLAAGQMDGVE